MGVFVISLDFEMLWGAIFNDSVKKGYEYRSPYVEIIIPKLLALFDKYQIHATWAIVGGIACEDSKQMLEQSSRLVSNPYRNETLLEFISSIPSEKASLYFRPDLVRMISNKPNQEIASHTFSHFYCYEHNEIGNKLAEEIVASQKILEGITHKKISTLVFPKNQINTLCSDIMQETGIKVFRGKQVSTQLVRNCKFSKLLHFMDAYLPIFSCSCYSHNTIYESKIINVRASRFWRTYYKPLFFLEFLKINRIKREMQYAARKNLVYHLWFHPHNLSSEYMRNLKTLDKIFEYYKELNIKYGFTSLNMGQCAEIGLK
ncbi:MAG: polysaccharide deacetylase family protein [Clostridiaceae bacterium]